MKYLLCRPKGGLNDTLCQIEKCWKYCEKNNRLLIIDTTKSGIFINFSDLFKPKNNLQFIFEINQSLINELNKLNCQIKELEGNIDNYTSEYLKNENYILKKVGTEIKSECIKLSFNFKKNYDEDLLIHEQCGGGVESLDLLKKLKLSDNMRSLFKKNEIEGDYKSIHVRNTDYKTDYRVLLENLKETLKDEKVLVCSDDYVVIEESIKVLNKSTIITKTSNNFSKSGIPLHSTYSNYTIEEKREITQNSIIDLLLLAKSKKIHYSILSGYNFYKISGFTKLALILNEKNDILEDLLGD